MPFLLEERNHQNTGSRKVIKMVNHYWHCVSYTTVEELETELPFSSHSEQKITPPEMRTDTNQCTRLAYDNYDRFVEISSGKDTLHDTVCIAYQRLTTQESTNEVTQESNQLATTARNKKNSKRKRAFVSDGLDIEPYHKKPKITSRAMVAIDHEGRSFVPKSYHSAKTKDTLWMIGCSFSDKETLMWVGCK